ncbi:MAG: hypothetical protein MK135_11610, partial [Polyangiaceae bacterium]|nr:hypothetical protein [Polyangiaceae bacterium]
QGNEALKILEPILKERPNSAELNFCMGLAGLEQTQKLGDARIFFRRATTYDATRATYFLYLGWVELALGDFAAAKSALNEALKLDQTLGDAYW